MLVELDRDEKVLQVLGQLLKLDDRHLDWALAQVKEILDQQKQEEFDSKYGDTGYPAEDWENSKLESLRKALTE